MSVSMSELSCLLCGVELELEPVHSRGHLAILQPGSSVVQTCALLQFLLLVRMKLTEDSDSKNVSCDHHFV